MYRYVVLVFAALVTDKAAQPQVVWQQVLGDTDANEALHGMDLQYPSVLYVVGENSVDDLDLAVLKLDLDGNLALAYTYDEGKKEMGKDITIGEAGNVYVIGHRTDSTLLFLKFDTAGNKLWDRRRFGHLGGHVLYSEDGVYFAGWYYLISNPDLRITKYGKDGNMLWSDFWQPIGDQTPTGLALDSEKSVYVSCKTPYMWCAWTLDGTPKRIIPRYEVEWAHGEGIALNSADHVFLCGDMGLGARTFMLIKNDIYGKFLWPDSAKRYDLGADEHCRDIKLDAISDCYLAGWQVRGSEEDVALVKTDSAGKMLWAWIDTVEGKQEIEAIEVDEEGYIYLAGSHHNGANWDMLVMKVAQPLTISGRVTDSTGKPMEDFPVFLSGDTTVEVLTDTGGYYTIEVYNGGSYTVSPNLPNWSFDPASYTYSPLAHRMFDQDFENGRWTGVGEDTYIRPSPYWKLISSVGPQIVLKYSGYPQDSHACFAVFDATGRKVDEIKSNTSSGIAAWGKCYGPGVYFIREVSGNPSVTRKVILVR